MVAKGIGPLWTQSGGYPKLCAAELDRKTVFAEAYEMLDSERGTGMAISTEAVKKMAREYTEAWNSKSAQAVALFYAEEGEIIINRGEPWTGRSRVADMASGFYADVPDLSLVCDEVRCAGPHAVYVWTFTGHDAKTGNPLKIRGWEEWDIGEDLKVKSSRGWFDADDYARQAAGA